MSLDLQRIKVFADNAEVFIHSDDSILRRTLPNNIYFSGFIQGSKNNRIFLGFLENGTIRGIMETADGTKYKLSQLENNQFKLDKPDTDLFTQNDSRYFNPKDFLELPESEAINQRTQATNQRGPNIDYQLTIAIETDYEFYQIFNNINNEVNYITDLIAYLSSMYYSEINTFVLLGHVSVWTTANDPWDATQTDCALYEVGKYWNDNHGQIDRATTHFISGKNFGGGIAWKGVLCQNQFNVDTSAAGCGFAIANANYGGAYGVSGSLSGSFNPGNPQVVWDIVVVSHEIGHNFDSPHTHCYANIGGNANPVDECYNAEPNCFSGTEVLPGPQGQGSGTLMSYCHTLSGGLSNISLTLGKNHAYGVQPQRVTNVMRSHVETAAQNNPQCIMPTANDLIFENGFE